MPGPEEQDQLYDDEQIDSFNMSMQPEAMVDEEAMMNIDDIRNMEHDKIMDTFEGNMPATEDSDEELSQFPDESELMDEDDFDVPAGYMEEPEPAFEPELPDEEEDIEEEPGSGTGGMGAAA